MKAKRYSVEQIVAKLREAEPARALFAPGHRRRVVRWRIMSTMSERAEKVGRRR